MKNYNMQYCNPMCGNWSNWGNNHVDYCADYGKDFSREGLKRSLEMIKDAVEGERADEKEYEYLISMAPNKEQKEIIKSIRDDEKNHGRWFREIYMHYTGKVICPKKDEDVKKPKSYLRGVRKALFGEMKAMEKYRLIRSGLPNRCDRDIVFQILTDEIKHGIYYNYILLMNLCRKSKRMRGEEGDNIPVIDTIDDMEDMDFVDNIDDMEDTDVINNVDDDYSEEDVNVEFFRSNDLFENISPLVDRALQEKDMGLNLEYLFSKFILSGALVGEGKDPEEALREVERWQENENSNIFIRE
ncbi:ferritin-like domain-containing protein [Clostridium cochlearium]|uniref:ferritin-like domain-containing protein n=1 Tax=Clostridium cochlearium TaxID=1494 RepID=UPI001981BE25|nr:ferritin-like domain-containing protein [Clostridium cochlearium]